MTLATKRSSADTVEAERPAKKAESSALDALKLITKVVADSGDFNSLEAFKPQDATTNPSLILQAVKLEAYKDLVEHAVKTAKEACADKENFEVLVPMICDELLVGFGEKILAIVPGVVSVEVDARLSFDKEASIARGRKIVEMFKAKGFDKSRLLVKLASTWEGCEAARVLEQEGIHCNLTLMFSLGQAIAAAEAGATLISPFVGRILDWHKKSTGIEYTAETDPGVLSVRNIFAYYKKFGYKTIVMGASFRNTGEILALAGCDNLTISPKLLSELQDMPSTQISRKLDKDNVECSFEQKLSMDEATFRWMLNEDQMATEKLSEGIRGFNADWDKLKVLLKEKYC